MPARPKKNYVSRLIPDPESPGKDVRYSDVIGREIVRRIGEGQTLSEICREKGMPDVATVWHWMENEENVEFSRGYVAARVKQAHSFVDEAVNIARSEKLTNRTAYAMKIRIDTLLTVAARLNPAQWSERYNAALAGGERITVNNTISLTPPNAQSGVAAPQVIENAKG